MYLSTPKHFSAIMQDGPLYVCDRQYDQANLLCYFLPQNSHHFYSDLDLACHFDADPDPTCQFDADAVRIRILPFIVMWIGIWFRILASKRKAQNLEKVLNRLIFHIFWLFLCKLMRIWIRTSLSFYLFPYCFQHCFICRPSDSPVPTDAGIEPRTVATGALAIRRPNH